MKKYGFLTCLLAIVMLLCGCTAPTPEPESGEALLGSFTAKDLEGGEQNEEIFRGHKLTMVNIWATFCSPCIAEMPELAQLQHELGEDFQIVGIVADAADRNGNLLPDQHSAALAIVEQTGADYLHLLPSPSLNEAYLAGVQAVPETVFVDENGVQVGESYLGARSKADWKAIAEKLLEQVK